MNKNNIIKLLPPYLLLIFLPCIFSLVLCIFIIKIDQKHEIDSIKIKLSERATDFISKSTAVDYFHPYFNKLADELFPFIEKRRNENGSYMTNQDVSKIINDLSKKLGENIRCATFDNNTKLLNPQDLLPHEQRFFSYAWKKIHRLVSKGYDQRRSDQNELIGDEFNTAPMEGQEEACMPTACPEKTCVFYFKNANKSKNGLIAFVEYKRTKLEIIQAKINDYATEDQPIILYDNEKQQNMISSIKYDEIPYEITNKEEFTDGFVKNNIIWKGYNAREYKLLLGQKTDLANKYRRKIILAIIILVSLLLISSVFFFRNLADDNGLYISIRYKLVFIFAIAVYIPTISLWFLSYSSLYNHRIAIENQVKKGLLDILNKVDSDFKTKEDVIDKCYSELDLYLKNLKGKKTPSFYEFKVTLQRIASRNNIGRNESFSWVDIRAVDKKQLYTTSTDDTNKRVNAIARVLSIVCLEKYCPSRLTYAKVKPSQSDILVGNMLENPAVGFTSIIERPGQLSYQVIDSENGVYWWWNYYPEVDNPVAFFIGNVTTRNLSISYFQSLLKKRYAVGNTEIKLVNYHIETQKFIPEVEDSKSFRELINVSSFNKRIKSSIINHKNTDYLCLCLPGSKIKDGYIIGMYPINDIDYQIEQVRSAIYKVMIFLFFITVLTGSLLAKTIITPINELNRGLVAIRKRETETQINIENRDELGHLGKAFNQMMSEIKDMLMAGAVQQCLIPTGNRNIDGYDCIIFNQMAADVGGDYADIFELANNRVLIVIGDVNGHGVSSSLISAMVKASVFMFANQNLELNEIVRNTSYMICDLIRNKMIMKFCAIVLDKDSGELSICNAGSPYPFIREKEIGKIRIPTNINLPMGISKSRSVFTSESEVLNVEDTLLLYTDGFMEAISNDIDGLGYENIKNTFSSIPTDNSEEIKNKLIDSYKQNLGEKESSDDITFIILKRKLLQDN